MSLARSLILSIEFKLKSKMFCLNAQLVSEYRVRVRLANNLKPVGMISCMLLLTIVPLQLERYNTATGCGGPISTLEFLLIKFN